MSLFKNISRTFIIFALSLSFVSLPAFANTTYTPVDIESDGANTYPLNIKNSINKQRVVSVFEDGGGNGMIEILDATGTPRMLLRPSGSRLGNKISINTNDAYDTLNVKAVNNVGGMTIYGPQDNIAIQLDNNMATGGKNWNILNTAGNSGYGQGKLITRVNNTPMITYTADTKMGLGTNDPTTKLHINSGVVPALRIDGSANNVNSSKVNTSTPARYIKINVEGTEYAMPLFTINP